MATLYIVGTPIGNLEDITLRALRVLSTVDLILCEDTRVTRKLLERHSIKTQTLSYHAHSKISRLERIIEILKEGKNLALVSDAGTPGISDPGAELLERIRQECTAAIESGQIKIESVPGPSAITAALSIAGVPLSSSGGGFTFLGFLPHKKGRETLFKEIGQSERVVVFYESPHRILKALDSLTKHAGVAKKITVCRELTKIYEQVISGTSAEVFEYFNTHSDRVRGEFVVIVSPE